MIDPDTILFNMMLILGGLVLLVGLCIAVAATWTATKIVIWLIQRRLAERAWREVSLRADGKPYPAFIEGACGECGRGGRKIYHPVDSAKALCPLCYERFWRRAEGYAGSVVVSAEADQGVRGGESKDGVQPPQRASLASRLRKRAARLVACRD